MQLHYVNITSRRPDIRYASTWKKAGINSFECSLGRTFQSLHQFCMEFLVLLNKKCGFTHKQISVDATILWDGLPRSPVHFCIRFRGMHPHAESGCKPSDNQQDRVERKRFFIEDWTGDYSEIVISKSAQSAKRTPVINTRNPTTCRMNTDVYYIGITSKQTMWLLVRERTIPTERQPFVAKVIAYFCG
jgi:hypothetical protein